MSARLLFAGVLTLAKRSPELVHLLQLQAHFPQASLARIVRGIHGADGKLGSTGRGVGAATGGPSSRPVSAAGEGDDDDGGAIGVGPKMRDAATETPVHFVEKHIDPRYVRLRSFWSRLCGVLPPQRRSGVMFTCAGTIGTSGRCGGRC